MSIRCLVMSDLHLEFEGGKNNPGPDISGMKGSVDLVLLAGDIDIADRGVSYAERVSKALSCPVCVIAGNHEFYNQNMGHVLDDMRRASKAEDIYVLENDVAEFKIRKRKIRVLGCVLWTDYALNGNVIEDMRMAHSALNDHRLIYMSAHDVFTPQDAMVLHRQSREFLTGEFSKSFDGTTVVMTHHAPSDMSVADRFKGDALSPAFASDLNHLIDASGSALWVHGHVHDSFDYHIGQTRVVCNPRGYYGREVNPGFSPNFVVEI